MHIRAQRGQPNFSHGFLSSRSCLPFGPRAASHRQTGSFLSGCTARRLHAGPARPFSCNRPHRVWACWEQTRRSLVSVTRWATSERGHPLHSYQAISWLLAVRAVRGDWTACPSLLQIQARSPTLKAPWVPVKNNHSLSVAYFSNTGSRGSQNYSNKCYEVLFPNRQAEKESK